MGTIRSYPLKTDFGDQTITNVTKIQLKEIVSDDDTSVTLTVGTDVGDDFIVKDDTGSQLLKADGNTSELDLPQGKLRVAGLTVDQTGNNSVIKNTDPGTLQLHSGVSGSGNLAFEINASGEVIVLGSDTPATDDVLSWDGSKAVWEPPAGGGAITMQTAANVDAAATVDTMVVVASDTAPVTVTLPAVAGNAGKFVIVKAQHGATNAVTVAGDGAETIDGKVSQSLTSSRASIEMICDGAEWWIR